MQRTILSSGMLNSLKRNPLILATTTRGLKNNNKVSKCTNNTKEENQNQQQYPDTDSNFWNKFAELGVSMKNMMNMLLGNAAHGTGAVEKDQSGSESGVPEKKPSDTHHDSKN